MGESQEGIIEDGNLAEGDDIDGVSRYVSKYIHMQSYYVHKYIMSARWVFPGWIGFSQWFKKEFGDYHPREMLVELRRISKEAREQHTWLGLYLWEKENIKGRK